MSIRTSTAAEETASKPAHGFRFCLNTSTVRGQKLTLEQEIDLAARVGYTGIEPWIGEIEDAQQRGVSLADLRKRLAGHGLAVESAIGFAKWIVDDEAERKAGLDQLKRDMGWVRELGGQFIAAPPVGMHEAGAPKVDLQAAADRYRAACELGDEMDVTPMVEVWGFSKNLSRLGESVYVALESGHPRACVLTDVYHIFKGGSDARSLRMLSGPALPVMHMNDYPAGKPREEMNDSDRVYPGDGVAPLNEILQVLAGVGFQGALSLELFNRSYWEQDAELVARTGLEKMQAAVSRALGG